MNRIDQAIDIINKLNATNQTYIIGHDIPVSISKYVYASLELKRREMAKELGVPENQFEFEDCVGILTGMISMETFKEAKQDSTSNIP
ncbi:hypothetical protein LCGC14_1090590 [marine sediment metagenome]|uniref:Uncharacterized protein n=1 Tax=marine sediment metagenome TaxID=412755 RepID=A0A0F9MGX7_9ZZZZ